MHSGEFEAILRLSQRFAKSTPGVEVGIGDDAAVLVPQSQQKLVWTVDAQVEHTHFTRELVSWSDEGWRSFVAAASDLAAMGATPWCALVALGVPVGFEDEDLDSLSEGQKRASDEVGASIVGGNLARAEAVSITTTLLGTARRPLLRSGAQPGDGVWVAGPLGLARAGLAALRDKRNDDRLRPAIHAWQSPRALVVEGLAMASVAHAGIDVSDGLVADVGHLAEASGVAVVLHEDAIRAQGGKTLRDVAAALGVDAMELALKGGEDYALIAASGVAIEGFVRIGEVRAGHGVHVRTAEGEKAVVGGGFDHFR